MSLLAHAPPCENLLLSDDLLAAHIISEWYHNLARDKQCAIDTLPFTKHILTFLGNLVVIACRILSSSTLCRGLEWRYWQAYHHLSSLRTICTNSRPRSLHVANSCKHVRLPSCSMFYSTTTLHTTPHDMLFLGVQSAISPQGSKT
jgi:hypothetical protein